MNSFLLTITTPGGEVFSGDVYMLSLRGAEGDLAILPGHIPFVTTVKAGEITIEKPDGEEIKAAAGDGLLTVAPDKATLLLCSYTSADN